VIDKFDSALNAKKVIDESTEIFVLVDESHRSQYGTTHTKIGRYFRKPAILVYWDPTLEERQEHGS
jgi:type I restriction enzyme R subunit